MTEYKRRPRSLVVDKNGAHSPRFYASWLARSICMQSVLRSVRRRDPKLKRVLKESGLARLDFAVSALDVMSIVWAQGRYRLRICEPDVAPILMMRFLGFFDGGGIVLEMTEPGHIDEDLVRLAIRRLPRLLLECRKPGVANIIQI